MVPTVLHVQMLEIGNGNLQIHEEKSHMAMWCMMASPLLAGNNLSAASPGVSLRVSARSFPRNAVMERWHRRLQRSSRF
jgi:hypothetical protein